MDDYVKGTIEVDLDIPSPKCGNLGARIREGVVEECFPCWAERPDPRDQKIAELEAKLREYEQTIMEQNELLQSERIQSNIWKGRLKAASDEVIRLEEERDSIEKTPGIGESREVRLGDWATPQEITRF